MKTAVIGVGTEIMLGQITDTNSTYISKELYHMGFDVLYHMCVGDNHDRLKKTIEEAMKDCDLIIASGGLGPTQDDITKEVVCEITGSKLACHEKYVNQYKDMYAQMNRVMPENNIKMAYLPENGTVFHNSAGMAPGFAIESDGRVFICLPGPPREMKAVFTEGVIPYLNSRMDAVLYSNSLMIFGRGESDVENDLQPLIIGQTNPTIATYAKEATVEVRITAKCPTLEEAIESADGMTEKVKGCVKANIYDSEGKELWEVVCAKLLKKHITLSSAESCTGGMFAAAITNMPGISEVFDRGIVTYSARAKMEELGVSRETIEMYGTVSSQTAEEMASGLSHVSGSRLCISVTGVAGPDPSEGKPVGLFYIGICCDGKTYALKFNKPGKSRDLTRKYAMLTMLNCINDIADTL